MPPGISIPLIGGVNRAVHQKRIRDDEVVSCQNVYPTESAIMSKRGALGYVKDVSRTSPTTYPIKMVVPRDDEDVDFIMVTRSVADQENTSIAVRSTSSGLFDSNNFSIPTPIQPAHVSMGGKVYFFGGDANVPGLIVEPEVGSVSGYGVNAYTYADSQVTTPAPKVACAYRSRMVLGNLGPGFERSLIFSDRDAPDTFGSDVLAANGRYFNVTALGQDEIIAIAEITQTAVGTPTQSALLILGRYTAVIMTGEPVLSDDPGPDYAGDATFNRVNYRCGCASAETLVQTETGLMWAGDDDVWLFQMGSMPVRVGSKIRPVLKATPRHLQYLWHAAYFNGSYRLSVMSPGQGPAEDSPCGEQWWMDLRQGPPSSPAEARWFGPMIFKTYNGRSATPNTGTRTLAVDERPGRDPALFGCELTYVNFLGVSPDGQVGIVQVQYDQLGAYDITTGQKFEEGDVLDDDYYFPTPSDCDGNQILVDILTKEYDCGDMQLDKLYLGCEINVMARSAVRLTVEAILDGGRVTDEQSTNVDIGGTYLGGFELGVGQADDTALTTEFQAIQVPPDPLNRPVGKTVQLRITDETGFPIVDSNKYFDFPISGTLSTGDLSAEAEFFATLTLLGDAVVDQVNDLATALGVAATLSDSVAAQWHEMTYSDIGYVIGFSYTGDNPGSTRRVATMLGYDTTENDWDNPVTARVSVPDSPAASFEIAGVVFFFEPFGRRPS